MERGLFTGGISKISKFSRTWMGSPLFPQSESSLKSLESLNALENAFSEKAPFPKDPFFRTRLFERKEPENQNPGREGGPLNRKETFAMFFER